MQMTTPWVADELNNRSTIVHRLIKDPATGDEHLEEDKSAVSFQFNTEELHKWAQAGLLDEKDIEVILTDLENSARKQKAIVDFNEKCKRQGRTPSQDELAVLLTQFPEPIEDTKKRLEIVRYILENKEKLLAFLQPRKINKFRQSGFFIDQKLKPDILPERTLFDLLSPEVQGKIEEYSIHTIGIPLAPAEDKMMTALLLLLHRKSENKDQKSPDFYKGNEDALPVLYGKETTNMPVIKCSLAELCKAYLGKNDYSGSELAHVKDTLFATEKKKFLVVYDRKRKTEKGKLLTDRIEDVRSLYKIIKYYEGLTEDELKNLNEGDQKLIDKRGELVIGFCPLLIDQIDKKYVEYPEDINRRMIVAAGGFKKLAEADNRLRDYLLRELSAKRYEASINECNLIPVLGLSNYAKSGRKKLIQMRIQTAIQTCKNLGLLIGHERIIGAKGQWKYEFVLNENFY